MGEKDINTDSLLKPPEQECDIILKMISEREMDVYLYILTYAKDFDNIHHKELLELLGKHNLFEKDNS